MRQHLYLNPCLRGAAALLIVITLSLTAVPPALALDLNPSDYFQFSFNTVNFDKSQVAAGEAFHATITGSAACIKDLPLPISEIIITSQVLAQPATGGAALVLNPQYVIDINPLPRTAGQSFNINQTVSLQFPAGAATGSYTVVGHVTKAEVKVIISIDVTSSFSQDQTLGTVKCIIPSTALTSSPTAGATVSTTSLPPINLGGPPPQIKTTQPQTTQPQTATTVNTFLMIAVVVIGIVAVALIILVIVLLRRRGI